LVQYRWRRYQLKFVGLWARIAADGRARIFKAEIYRMNAIKIYGEINHCRRQLLNTAAMGIAVAGVAKLFPSQLVAAAAADAIRPFRVDIPDEQLVDLRRRIAATRWPDKETVSDRSQGNQLGKLQEVVRYWRTDYDWRKVEARLNALPQFMTEIDGLDIHFIHVRSKHENALPLIVTHGWPGSIIEQLKIIDPLTNPTSHGGSASDSFHLVIPSMPGYGFSGKPKGTGWNPDRIGRAWAELMTRLGYTRYVAQGGDWGSPVSSAMARQAPAGLLGIHINLPATVPVEVAAVLAGGGPAPAGLSEKERAAFDSLDMFYKKSRAYALIMGTRPQMIGYALADSPVGLAAFMYDYNNGEPRAVTHQRRHAGRHHAVLADEQRDLGSAVILGDQRPKCSSRGRAEDWRDLSSGGHHGISGGGLSSPGDMGPACLSQPDLLPRGRQGRTLRRVGRAGALQCRAPSSVPIAPLIDLKVGARCARATLQS
jgi:pimeloyl-ACP methyl ester carboxylesterase